MNARHPAAGLAVLFAAGLSARVSMAADEREQCASSAEQAQQLRDDGKYRQARREMLACARSACPGPIKGDCGRWLVELDRDAPTVVFGARDPAGKDLFDVKVSMDRELLQSRIDGKPVLVDVGEHTFTFESADGSTKDERVLVRTAEKSRSIIVTLASGAAAPSPQPAPPATTNDTTVALMPPARQPSLVPTGIAAGVAAIAFTSFAIYGISGESDLDDFEKCKPTCDEKRVDYAKTKLTIADVSLAVGVVATGLAAYLFLTRKSSPPPSSAHRVTLDGGALVGGGYASVGGTF